MPSPSLTLQCRQCNGVFATPKVEFSSLVQCPHCATTAPVDQFSALQENPRQDLGVGSSTSPTPPPAESAEQSQPEKPEGDFQVRGKWLQFDCPHCVRPMRLIAEDAGGLVDCAHCGLELVAPDPTLGRGARLSRASEGRVGSISRFNLRDLRGDQIEHSKTGEDFDSDPGGPFGVADDDEEEDEVVGETIDPNHALARSGAAEPAEPKRAVKALEPDKLGKSFRRKEVLAEQAAAASDKDWEPLADERPAFAESRLDRYGFWIALGVAAVVMAGIVFMVVREAGTPETELSENSAKIAEIQETQKAKNKSYKESFASAKSVLASPTWESLAPLVRDSERVAPLMRQYYSSKNYQPVDLVSFHAPVEVQVGELTMHQMKVTDAEGNDSTLVLERGATGPRIDWELMVNLPLHDWATFLESRPSAPKTVRIVAARASVQDRYFRDAGLTRDNAIGIRLGHGSGDDFYFAVLPKGGAMATKMTEILEWGEKGRKIIIGASFDPDSKLNDRIQINEFLQTGWIIQK